MSGWQDEKACSPGSFNKRCTIIVKHYLTLLKRWWWLVLLGVFLGGAAGLLYSRNETPVFQATSRLMFVQQNDNVDAGLSYLNDRNMAQTLSQLVIARPVVQEASEQLGYPVNPRNLTASQVGETHVIEVVVMDGNPIRATEIANAVMDVFIAQQDTLRDSLFASSEESLKLQIDQVKAQMDALQNDAIQEADQLKDEQVANLEAEIRSIRAEINTLQQDLVDLQYAGTPVPGFDENRRWTNILPTPSVDQRVEIANKTTRLDELERLAALYERLYVDLTVRSDTQRVADTVPDDVQITLDQYQTIYRNLLQNYETIRLAKVQSTPELIVVESAALPDGPIRPIPVLYTALGALLGLMTSFGLAFVFVNTDEIFRTPEEARILLRLPILAYVRNLLDNPVPAPSSSVKVLNAGDAAVLPEKTGQMEGLAPYAAPARGKHPLSGDGLRFLRSNLEVLRDDQPIHSLLVTAPGDTTTGALLAVRLAQMMAQAGKRVLLVDADLRDPQVAKILGISEEEGLADVLEDNVPLLKTIQMVDGDCLSVIPAGKLKKTPADVMDRDNLKVILEELEQRAEMVIVNSPPFAFAEAGVLSSRVDGVLLVIEMNHTRSTTALATMEQLYLSRANVLGMVIV